MRKGGKDVVMVSLSFLICRYLVVALCSIAAAIAAELPHTPYYDVSLQETDAITRQHHFDRVSNIAIDPNADRIIVGAKNHLLVFSSYLEGPLTELTTEPTEKARILCRLDASKNFCNNYNKVLQFAAGSLLACGTGANQPQCSWHRPSDLQVFGREFSAERFVSPDPDAHGLAIYRESDESIFAGVRHPDRSAFVRWKSNRQYLETFPREDHISSQAQFISAFPVKDWMYFLFKEPAVEVKDSLIYSRVARVCLNDPGLNSFPRNFQSFVKARITCTNPGNGREAFYHFNHIVDAKNLYGTWGSAGEEETRMFAIFSSPKNAPIGSALCVYSYNPDAEDRTNMMTVFDGPYLGKESTRSNEMRWNVRYSNRHFECSQTRLLNETLSVFFMQNVVTQMTARPSVFVTNERFTSFAIERAARGDAVAFIGTERGNVLKIVFNKGEPLLVEKIPLSSTCITKLILNSFAGIFYAMNSTMIHAFPMQRCSRFKTCGACIKAQDPYCGWCQSPDGDSCMTQSQCGKHRFGQNFTSVSYLPYCRFTYYEAPKVTMEEVEKVVEGDNVILRCYATGWPQPKIKRWEKNFLQQLHPLDFGKLTWAEVGSTIMLSKVTKFNEGHYTCVFENEAGTGEASREIRIFAPATIVDGPNDVEAVENRASFFRCNVSGDPTPDVQWYFRRRWGTGRPESLPAGVINVGGGILIVTSPNEKTEGMYQCSVSNDLQTDVSKWATLTVLYPPRLREKESMLKKEYSTEVGGSVKLQCAAGGNPKPDVTWFHNGRRVASNERNAFPSNDDFLYDAKRFVVKGNGNLEIFNAELTDEGIWECRGKNKAGEAILKTLTLTIKSIWFDRYSVIVTPSHLTVSVGDSAEFRCKTKTQSNETIIKWFKHDSGTKLWIEIREIDGPTTYVSKRNTLLFPRVDSRDGGEYMCVATNGRGQRPQNQSATLTVTRIPTVSSGASGVVSFNETLNVSALAHFMCAVAQKRPGESTRFFTAEIDASPNAFDDADKRTLTCSGGVVGDKVAARLFISNLPAIVESPPALILASQRPRARTTLVCDAHCSNPEKYKIVWTQNGNMIEDTPKSGFTIKTKGCRSWLSIEEVEMESKEYFCWYRSLDRNGAVSSRRSYIDLNSFNNSLLQYPLLVYYVSEGDNVSLACPLEPPYYDATPTWSKYVESKRRFKPLRCENQFQCKEDVFCIEKIHQRDMKYRYFCSYGNSNSKGEIHIINASKVKGFPVDLSQYVKGNGWDWQWAVAPQRD